jgi:hypothetical protein
MTSGSFKPKEAFAYSARRLPAEPQSHSRRPLLTRSRNSQWEQSPFMTELNLSARLVSKDRQASILAARIESYLERRSGVSLVEMARDIPGFSGGETWGREDQNIILWADMSEAAIAAMKRLLDAERIIPTPTTWLVYSFDGTVLNMPIAKSIRRSYSEPHWLPLVFAGCGEAH